MEECANWLVEGAGAGRLGGEERRSGQLSARGEGWMLDGTVHDDVVCGAAGGCDGQKARRRTRGKARASMVTPSDDSGLLLLRLIEDR